MNSGALMHQFWGRETVRRHAEGLRVLGLAVTALVLYLFELGKGALPDWDSAIYAEVTKEMMRGHHWLTPYWNYQPFFEKPPLLYWAQMLSFHLLGIDEFAARLPSALAGVGIVLLVYALTRRMAGPLAGLFAGLVLLTTHRFDHSMRLGTTDALLCLCIYLTVYGYVRMMEGDGRWFVLMCAGTGLGILAKGPAELVAPMAIGVDWIFRREWKDPLSGWALGRWGVRRTGWRGFWLGVVVLAVIVLPWHVWMVARYGWGFLDNYAGYQVLDRATRALEGNSHGWLYYFRVLGRGAFPWWVLGVVAGARRVWRREWKHALPWLLMGVTLGLYTAVQTKLYWYVLPFYPALAMEVGRLLAEWSRRWRVVGYTTAAVILVGFGVGFWKLVSWPGDPTANREKAIALVVEAEGDPGPLLVVGEPGLEPELDIRTALFYSSRRAVWQQLPNDMSRLGAAVKQYPAVDVMMLKTTAQTVGQRFVVRPVMETGDVELARVSRKP